MPNVSKKIPGQRKISYAVDIPTFPAVGTNKRYVNFAQRGGLAAPEAFLEPFNLALLNTHASGNICDTLGRSLPTGGDPISLISLLQYS